MDVRLREDGKNENIRAAFPNHDLLDNSCSLAWEHGETRLAVVYYLIKHLNPGLFISGQSHAGVL